MAIRAFRLRCAVWIVFVVAMALVFAGRADASVLDAHGLPVDQCASRNCAEVEVTLTGSPAGHTPGNGRIVSTPAGIDCVVTAGVASGVCSYVFSWSAFQGSTLVVSLTATAAPGSFVVPYSPDVGDSSYTRTQTLQNGVPAPQYWSFSFSLRRFPLEVTTSGAGSGKVTSAPAGISCGASCSKEFDHATKVTLTAAPDAGAVFKQWTGACNGQGAACTLTITQATSTNAVFELAGQGGATGGGTTGGGTSGGGPTGGVAAGGGDAADVSVDVRVIAVKVGKSRLGKRVVRLEMSGNETISVELTLVRAGKALARTKTGKLKEGDRLITLPVPRAVTKGKATLRIVFTDSAGNARTVTRGVRLGKA